MSYNISVQLFTLREETKSDFIGTLEKVAEMGYQGVEFAGYGDISASEMRKHLDRLGLKASGSHAGIAKLTDELDSLLEYNLEIGSSYIILPWTQFTTVDEYLDLAKLCNKVGEKCKEKGIQFCYHNHAREFDIFDGKYALDILFDQCKPELVQAEIDVYWVQYGGLDPAQYIKKYAGRCPLLHIKDMEDNENRDFTEIGNGILDIKGIAAVANEMGTEWLIVEQDKCKRPALESVAISYNNLKKLNIV